MKVVALAIIFALSAPAWAQEKACPRHLPQSVEAKLLPVLNAREAAVRKNDWWDIGYEKAFETLLKSGDEDSVRARVALMDYYVGEAYGEVLVCAVALDGQRVEKLLELHARCDIKPRQSRAPRDRTLPLRAYAQKLLKDGHVKDSCTYE
jgi:hypothetical protein